MTHPTVELDEVIHQRTRLGIVAVLMEARRADFRYLKDALDLTDGNLSRHLQILEQAGYVRITKGFEGKRPRTWVAVTKLGRDAFGAEMYALRQIAERFASAEVVNDAGREPGAAGADPLAT